VVFFILPKRKTRQKNRRGYGMNIDEIRKTWVAKTGNKQAAVDLWDSMAMSFSKDELPQFGDDPFLVFLEKIGALNPAYDVLDVGCGTGRYTLALAERCKSATGIDLSSRMLEYAQEQKDAMNCSNVRFLQGDWHDADLKELDMEQRYDLVFAHMTPAVQGAATFEKLTAASKGLCAMTKPTRRTDPVSDEVKKAVGITAHRESADNDMQYAFGLLWVQGYEPHFEYRTERWDMRKTLDEAYGLYINRVKSYKEITAKEEQYLKDMIRSMADAEGFVNETVHTTATTIYWNVNAEK
jgi:SAM-dependent methyltransferase